VVVLLFEFGLDGVKQRSIDDGGLFARQELTLECHLANVKSVAEQIGEGTARERDAADGLPCLQRPALGGDPALSKLSQQQIETAEREVASEYSADCLGLRRVHCDLAIFGVVAQWGHPADPQTFALGGGDFIPDTL